MAVCNLIPFLEVVNADRLDAEYFRADFVDIEKRVKRLDARPLGLIASYISRGIQPKYVEDGKIPVLRTVNIRKEGITDTRQEFVTEDFYEKNPRGQVYEKDILITSTGVGTLGRVTYVSVIMPLFADGHITIVRGIQDLNLLFVTAFLQSKIGLALIEKRQRGSSGQIEIYPSDLASIPIPKLPQSFQERIASQLSAAKEKRQLSYDLYIAAETLLLDEVGLNKSDLSSPKTNIAKFSEAMNAQRIDAEYFQPKYRKVTEYLSANWPVEKIGQWNEVLKGRSVSYVEKGIPVIRSGDLKDLEDIDDLKNADPEDDLFYLQPGDVCISSIGFGSIGKVQVFDKPGLYATVSEVTVVRQKRVNPYYLQIFLQSLAGQLQIEQCVTGATGQQHLYSKDVANILVPILPIQKQEKFEELVMLSRRYKQEAKHQLEKAHRQVEEMILSGE